MSLTLKSLKSAKNDKKKEGGKALFQGWALVDNTQNEVTPFYF
jgi:hypothetical protein